jgi:hypothetical protein
MPKATYKGPGDAVELDGITVNRGESIELTNTQVARIRADPGAEVEIEGEPTSESDEDVARIQADQAERREQLSQADRDRRAKAAAVAEAQRTRRSSARAAKEG